MLQIEVLFEYDAALVLGNRFVREDRLGRLESFLVVLLHTNSVEPSPQLYLWAVYVVLRRLGRSVAQVLEHFSRQVIGLCLFVCIRKLLAVKRKAKKKHS